MLRIEEVQGGPVTFLMLGGSLDVVTSPELERRLSTLIELKLKHIVLDLSQLVLVTSMGMRVFLAFAKLIRKIDGKVVFCSLSTDVQCVFKLIGFDTLFDICATREEAARCFQS